MRVDLEHLPKPHQLFFKIKKSILILCTGNSCRSHLAEGLFKDLASDFFEVYSAGSKPAGFVHPKAIAVLKEIDIDISQNHSKHLDEFLNQNIDTVITVCGNADAACPRFPGQANRYHWGFPDPAHAGGSDEEILAVFRQVRDDIHRTIKAYLHGYRESNECVSRMEETLSSANLRL